MAKWNILALFLFGFCSTVKASSLTLDSHNLTIGNETEQVSCRFPVSIDKPRTSISWQKNGETIANGSDLPIYQQVNGTSSHLIANITFANPQPYDGGEYDCVVYERGSKIDNITLFVTVENFVEDVNPVVRRLDLSIEIRTTFRARPQPELTWKVNDVALEKNDEYLLNTTSYNHTTLNFSDVFTIKSLLYFGKDPRLALTVVSGNDSVHTGIVNLDSGLTNFDGNSFEVQLSVSSVEKVRDECARLGGYVDEEAVRNIVCRIRAAELQIDEERNGEFCPGNSLPIVIDNYVTDEQGTYQLQLKRGDEVLMTNNHAIRPQVKTILPGLQPRTNYAIEFRYQPKYWTEPITMIRNLSTGGDTPAQPTIKRAHLSSSRTDCTFDMDLPSSNGTDQITQILILQHPSFAYLPVTIRMNYSVSKSTYTFRTVQNSEGDVVFSVQLESCHGEVGVQSVEHTCVDATVADSSPTVIILATIGTIILVIIVAIALYFVRRKRWCTQRRKQSIDDEYYIDVSNIVGVVGLPKHGNYVDMKPKADPTDGNYIDLDMRPGPSRVTSLSVSAPRISPGNLEPTSHAKSAPASSYYENIEIPKNVAIANSLLRKFKK